MISAFQSAISGLYAASTRISSSGNNIANANTDGFKKTRVILESADPQGVRSRVEKVNTPGTTVMKEGENGLDIVELSNVDLGREIPEAYLNSHMYKANLKTIETSSDMLDSLLKLK